MKKSFLLFLSRAVLLTGTLSIALGINYLSAWTGAPGSFPTCPSGTTGCDAPINVGSTNQIKTGGLTAGSLVTTGSGYITNKLGIGSGKTNPAYLLDLGGTPGTDGIRFPDGTVQTSANQPSYFQCSSGGYYAGGNSVFSCVRLSTGGTCSANSAASPWPPTNTWTCKSHPGWGLAASNPRNIACLAPADSNRGQLSCLDLTTGTDCYWDENVGNSWNCYSAGAGLNFSSI